MKYFATVAGTTYEVEIKAEGHITVDQEELAVDFQSLAGQPVYSLIVDGKSHEASVQPTETGLEVLLRGQLYQVQVEDELQRRVRESLGPKAIETGEFKLRAPMPGLVVAVPIERDQTVVQDQLLVVLESMKMQNELKAPREGRIQRIHIKPGDSVNQNQVLIVMD